MPRHIQKDPTAFFSVVGAPFIRENRSEPSHRHDEPSGAPRPGTTGIAVLWLLFYAVVAGAALLADGGAAKLIEVANWW